MAIEMVGKKKARKQGCGLKYISLSHMLCCGVPIFVSFLLSSLSLSLSKTSYRGNLVTQKVICLFSTQKVFFENLTLFFILIKRNLAGLLAC